MERSITALLKKRDKIKEVILGKQIQATIFFADMAGSTEYKLLRGPLTAQEKIYRYLDAITEIVKFHEGDVVKYLGDGLMAKFEGKDSATNAIKVAIKVQTAFKEYNDKSKIPDADKIRSKIGIHSGSIFLWAFEGHEPLDPQGTTTDIASRICDLAKPTQILCSADCKNMCSKTLNIDFATPVPRELKGIKSKIDICEVIWSEELKVNETVHISRPNRTIESLLIEATNNRDSQEYGAAIELYKAILTHDPEHFVANLMLARIMYMEDIGQLNDILNYADSARKSNPFSPMAKLIYAVVLWDIHQENLTDELLETIIAETESVFNIAREQLDKYLELTAANSLSYFYVERYGRKNAPQDLNRAIELCVYINRECEWICINQLGAFYDTYGCAIMMRGKNGDLKEAYTLFNKALQINPGYSLAHKHIAALIEVARKRRVPLSNLKSL